MAANDRRIAIQQLAGQMPSRPADQKNTAILRRIRRAQPNRNGAGPPAQIEVRDRLPSDDESSGVQPLNRILIERPGEFTIHGVGPFCCSPQEGMRSHYIDHKLREHKDPAHGGRRVSSRCARSNSNSMLRRGLLNACSRYSWDGKTKRDRNDRGRNAYAMSGGFRGYTEQFAGFSSALHGVRGRAP